MASSSLLRLQENHISSFVFQEDTCRILRSRRIYFEEPHPYIINYLKMSGFYNASQVRRFVLLPDLISALIERWRPETHTFHFPFGECTITLEDVALQLGLPIDGMAVTGCSLLDWKDECQNLLGVVPPEEHLNGSRVKLTWLQSTFQHLPENASEKDIKYAARAYILRLIGGVLMPDKSGNLVHLMYLPLLRDFKLAGTYSWGSACLGFLYRELCRATIPKTHDIGGCLVLLQSWAWYRLPFLAPRTATAPVYPLASRWNSRKVHPGIPSGLPSIREQLDRLEYDKFIWMPYSSKEILVCLPIEAYNHCHLWNTNTALICFAVVAWHQTDRVMRQFGMQQSISEMPMNLDMLHKIDMRGHHDEQWLAKHKEWIELWDMRSQKIPHGYPIVGNDFKPSDEYRRWYMDEGKPFVCPISESEDARSR